MVKQVEQPSDEQEEGIKEAEIDDNNNNSDEEVREEVGIEFIEQKSDPKNNENVIEFSWLEIQGKDEENIAKINLIGSLQKQADVEIFPKRVTGKLFDYYGILPKEEKQKIRKHSSL